MTSQSFESIVHDELQYFLGISFPPLGFGEVDGEVAIAVFGVIVSNGDDTDEFVCLLDFYYSVKAIVVELKCCDAILNNQGKGRWGVTC